KKTGGAGIALTPRTSAQLVIDTTRLMTFRTENEKAACTDDTVVLFVGFRFVTIEDLVPLIRVNNVFLAGVVEERGFAVVGFALDLALRHTHALRQSFLDAFLLRHELGVSAQQNVGTATGHVGGDGYGTLATGLSNDFGFALVELRVENYVLDALLFQQLRKTFGFLNRSRTHQHGLLFFVQFLDLVGGSEVLLLLGAVNDVRVLDP